MSTDKKQGGISPNDFTATLGEYVAARVAEESAAGRRRALMARFEKLGAHKPGLQLFLKLRNMEPADAELTLVSALRYCRWAQLEVGQQASLFAADDLGAPSEKAAAQLSEAQAEEMGYELGVNGRDVDDCGFPPGSPLYAKAFKGWKRGQAVLAFQMGEELPEDGGVLRRKVRKKGAEDGAEIRQAKPKGSGRRRGRRNADFLPRAIEAG